MDATCLGLGVQSWPGFSFRCGDLIVYSEWAVKVLPTALSAPIHVCNDVDDGYDQTWHYSETRDFLGGQSQGTRVAWMSAGRLIGARRAISIAGNTRS